MSRNRDWCFTIFQKDEKQLEVIDYADDMNYLVYQEEICPKTKKNHVQGYVEFKEKKALKALKKEFGNDIHWEERLGTKEQARDYCMKIESRVPGTEPLEAGLFKRQGKRTDLNSLHEDIKSGKTMYEIIENNPSAGLKFVRNIKEVKSIYDSHGAPRERKIEVIWLYGDAGTGKSTIANENGCYTMTSNCGKWFDGYENENVILFDDYDGYYTRAQLLTITDKWKYKCQIKGGFVWARWTKIYFTSNFPIQQVIPWYSECAATQRRFTAIHKVTGLGILGPNEKL